MAENPRHRRMKIVATLGPASASAERIEELFRAGADVFRLNFSHGVHDDYSAFVELFRIVERRVKLPIAIVTNKQ